VPTDNLPLALWLLDPLHDVIAAVLAVLLYRPAADLVRFVTASPAARRHYPGMIRARHRWHWLCRCTGLAQPELAAGIRPGAESRALVLILLVGISRLLALLLGIESAERTARILYPRARQWRLTDYGWQCVVKTAPRTGRKEVEKQAAHIADYWRSVRVGVTQAAPGRLIIRALRDDPLAVPFGPDQCPVGTYEPHQPTVLYVGRDDFGNDRYLPLRGLTGICVSGLPGYGKTSLISSWLCQLTTTPAAQFVLLDGKDGGDQEPWRDRAWRHGGDQLINALAVLEDVHAEMRRRLRNIVSICGQRNAWNADGPTEDLPLLITVLDECQTYLDLAQHKGDRATENLARRCIALAGELIRKRPLRPLPHHPGHPEDHRRLHTDQPARQLGPRRLLRPQDHRKQCRRPRRRHTRISRLQPDSAARDAQRDRNRRGHAHHRNRPLHPSPRPRDNRALGGGPRRGDGASPL
jgi:hypothetical protein